MAQQYINGELVDDGTEDQSYNPMAGLQSTSTPNRQVNAMSTQASLYDTPGWESKVNTMGLTPNWDVFKKAGQDYNISPEDWSKGFQHYNDKITPFAGNSEWWGQDAMTRAGLQGYAAANPNANFNWEQYMNPQREAMQQKQKADEGMARQNQGDDDLFGSLLPLLLVGGLGLATGGFGFGAGAGLGAGSAAVPGAASALSTAGSFGAGLGATEATLGSVLGGAGSFSAGAGAGGASLFGAGAAGGAAAGMDSVGDWAGDFGGGGDLPVGNTLSDIPYYGGETLSDPGLYDMFNQGGLDFEGAGNFLGNAETSATNLEQALNVPNQAQIPNVDISQTPESFSGYNPETGTSIDQVASQGLDSPAPIREAGVNASIPDQARLGLKGLNSMTNSPYFQVPKTLYNLYSQNQKAKQLEGMMKMMQEKSDVGGPFRDMLMRSYNDPNFFKSMPEFGAGMDAFNQQYGATAAQKGMRSQLGGAAHNIAVNREGARLADMFRSRLAGPASQGPDMRSMAAMAPAVANAQGNQFNSLFDPQLWNSLKGLF